MDVIIEQFHFLRPWWLLAILPALVIVWLVYRQHQNQGQWHSYLPPHLSSLLIDGAQTSQSKRWLFALVIGWLFAIIALAGPTWQKIERPMYVANKAQVIITDMSLSMYATDLVPNRLTRAKYKVTDLIKQLGEGETGLVAYAGDAFIISPMTEDNVNLLNLLPALNPEIMPVFGSQPSLAIEKALALLDQTKHQQSQLYLITDGLTPEDARLIKQQLKHTQHQLNILAVGTQAGAPVTLPSGQLLKDDNGNIVVPKVNFSLLKRLANDLSGNFSVLGSSNQDLATLTSHLSTSIFDSNKSDNQMGDSWHEVGPYLLLILIPLAAMIFRRGVLAIALLTVFVSTPQPSYADEKSAITQAAPSPTPEAEQHVSAQNQWWHNLWKTADQQAYQSFKEQKLSQAAQQFENTDWRGVSYYNQGEYEQALSAFEQRNDAKALYNQGNALSKLEQYEQAINRYQQSLKQQPDFEQAQKNLEIAKALLKQKQQQQEKEQQQNKDQKNQDQQDQENNDSNDQQGRDSDSEQSKKGQENPNANQKSDEQHQQQSPSDETQDEQGGQQSQQSQQAQNNEKEDQAKTEMSPEEKEALAKQQQQAQALQQTFDQENLTKEQLQHLNQLVKKIPDNPSLLLKTKMAVEARKRQLQRTTTRNNQKW
ncbi:VWA domain-containing protein [Psychrobium sp. 1_MG-2023]|uniref:VWA domain-containing protein n=1 Tax=Psychrobium sp. 1_MG-2023 TaxID=3062624 RepID=UPI000C33CF2C|nr:VWA domain-containing protein [Psychrobium sp. 1_MG-2023]MDP2561738.1 VWA domain-containing protein [Psychrobium sp. 1_MG-2023]PKF59773.1 hypothetical protein CW748_00820 [Alteromonadales bacterium alter-6D02]